jgi:hypothetical protein
MNAETKNCQSCKQPFIIEPEDFNFYVKIDVPPPTFCPDCRLQRRMAFRNERTLYKRKCDAPGHDEEMLSLFSSDNPPAGLRPVVLVGRWVGSDGVREAG